MVSASKSDDSIPVPIAKAASPSQPRITLTATAEAHLRRQCNGVLVHISRDSFLQFPVSCFGFYPYLCEHCVLWVFRPYYKQFIASICLTIVVLSALADDTRLLLTGTLWETLQVLV